MRYFLYLLLATSLLACETGPDTATETTNTAPDRAAAAEDGTMAMTPQTLKPEVLFVYEDIIWSFQFLPDGRMVATDKAGKLLLIDADGAAFETIVDGLPEVKSEGQGGLLEVLPSQEFASDRTLYLAYSKPNAAGDAATAVGRGRLSDDEARLENFEVLYDMEDKTGKGQHYGSRMVWGPQDGHLYFTIGDRGNRDQNPQDTTRDGGKVYRIAKDGSIPADNPFAGVRGAKEAIYSYGHRNAQSMAVHPKTGEIWETEHGPRGGDEINIIEAGLNYGWPEITYGINYNGTQITQEVSKEGMEQPLHYWVPSIAPSGMCFISGGRYPGWEGDLLVGSLKFMRVQHIDLDGNKVVGENKVLENFGRVRDLRMGPDGWAYASVEGEGIVRLTTDDI